MNAGAPPEPQGLNRGSLLAVALLATVWGRSLPTTLTDFDGGEFCMLAVDGGVAHAPGYPLWVWLLRGAVAVRGGLTVVQACAGLSLLFALAAAALMHRVAARVCGSSGAALVGVVAVGLSTPVWRAANSPEPFALNLFLAALVCWSCHVATSGRPMALCLSGWAMGAGVANHHTLVLCLPLVGWAAWRVRRVDVGVAWVVAAVLGVFPVLGLLGPYSPDAWVVGDWSEPWRAFWDHLLRRGYGTFSLVAGGQAPPWLGPWGVVRELPWWLGGVFLLALLAGLPGLGRSAFGRAHGVVLVLAGLAFPLLFRVESTPLEGMLVERFLALPLLLAAVPISLGWMWVPRRMGPGAHGVAAVVLVLQGALHAGPSNRADELFLEQHVSNVLHNVETPALVVTASDHDQWGFFYGQRVLGWGRGVEVFPVGYARSAWFMGPLADRLGVPRGLPPEALLRAAQARGWHLYTLHDGLPLLAPLLGNAWPQGAWVRMEAPGTVPPGAQQVFAYNVALLDRLQLPGPDEVNSMTPVEQKVLVRYARPWLMLESALEAAGLPAEAERCRRMARVFSPP